MKRPRFDNFLLELRRSLAMFFAQRLVKQADKTWEEKNWTNQDMDNMLNTKMRKTK